jgi:hypothetical protein
VSGVVTDSIGGPLQGAIVRLDGNSEARRITDSNGRFTFAPVQPGMHVIRASRVGSAPVTDSIVVTRDHPAHVQLKMQVMRFVLETLPPRMPRSASADTAPHNAEIIDLVARTARLPLLRAGPNRVDRRELRIWIGFGMGIPMKLVRFTVAGNRVRGEEIFWLVQRLSEPGGRPRSQAVLADIPTWLRSTFACGPVAMDTIRSPGESRGSGELVAACRRRFRTEPDWRALLTELESHDVWRLPDATELPQLGIVGGALLTVDGVTMIVEAWDGTRYHTYSYHEPEQQPSAPAKHAAAIMTRLLRLGATSESSSR